MIDLLRRQLDQQHEKIRRFTISIPPKGWIRSIREALGMTLQQLGKKMEISPQAVQAIEESEKSNTITLKTLHKAADALNCKLFYVLIPHEKLQKIVENQMLRKAKSIVETVSHSMKLEEQNTTEDEIESQIQKVIEDIKNRKKISLIWED